MSPSPESRFFYGWYIVIISFVCNFMTAGTGFYIFNAFMQPLVEQKGWTYSQVSVALVIGPAVALVCQLIYGVILYRTGPRILMALGPLASGISCIMIGRVDDIWMFYFYFVLLGFGNGAMSGIAAGTAVNNWFVLKRGKAIGLATAGISLSGAVLPFVAMVILKKTSLSTAYVYIGMIVILVSPFAWLLVRNWPEEYGLTPDGIPHDKRVEPLGADEEPAPGDMESIDSPRWTLKLLVKAPAFWKIGVSYAMVMVGVAGVMSQLKPRFNHLGLDDFSAMGFMSATALLGTFGKFYWGSLCDRMDPRRVAAIIMTGGAIGMIVNMVASSIPAIVVFVLVYGFAMGGVLSTLPIMVANFFGRYSFASVAKFLAVFMFFQGIGPIAMGKSVDLTDSYNNAFILFIVLNFLAAALIWSVKKPRLPRNKK